MVRKIIGGREAEGRQTDPVRYMKTLTGCFAAVKTPHRRRSKTGRMFMMEGRGRIVCVLASPGCCAGS